LHQIEEALDAEMSQLLVTNGVLAQAQDRTLSAQNECLIGAENHPRYCAV